jgi:hypothetical protein
MSQKKNIHKEKINCLKCEYYKVTWNPKKPHECKAYNFKSKYFPNLILLRETGIACQYFKLK